MSYYFKYNDIDLTDIARIRSVDIPALPSADEDRR